VEWFYRLGKSSLIRASSDWTDVRNSVTSSGGQTNKFSNSRWWEGVDKQDDSTNG
jgi:hypothetical protein